MSDLNPTLKDGTPQGNSSGGGLPIVAGLAAQAAGGLINSYFSKKSTEYQTQQQKELMKYQWDNFLSPLAQVNNMALAGLNPAAMFSNGEAITSGPSVGSVTAPQFGIGTTSMSDLAAVLLATAQAKKAGADTKSTEQDIAIKAIQRDRDELELKYRKMFGSSQLAIEVANQYQALRLAQQQEDTNKIEQEEKRWKAVTQKILSELTGNQRDIVAKELANKDKELGLRNQLLEEQAKTERSSQSANYASAENSKASANNYRQQARINSVLADISEATSKQEIETKISELVKDKALSETDAEQARQKLQAITNMRDGGTREKIDDFLIWLKDRLNILK